jgi:hypothetical protein
VVEGLMVKGKHGLLFPLSNESFFFGYDFFAVFASKKIKRQVGIVFVVD